ncbi:hypothetical protein [Bradyrhizobium sp. 35]|uniref:hypothetical protein n=1 Tax=Bradyrhizobium sp. 35 TaxID=2782670 RepID=UPI001FF9B54E|nr:hypothetical protein [Bradyrhizobium sp. 35]
MHVDLATVALVPTGEIVAHPLLHRLYKPFIVKNGQQVIDRLFAVPRPRLDIASQDGLGFFYRSGYAIRHADTPLTGKENARKNGVFPKGGPPGEQRPSLGRLHMLGELDLLRPVPTAAHEAGASALIA